MLTVALAPPFHKEHDPQIFLFKKICETSEKLVLKKKKSKLSEGLHQAFLRLLKGLPPNYKKSLEVL
jgi:hypothetical protein